MRTVNSELNLSTQDLQIREREVRNETPSPNPQVSGGLGLGYMATCAAFLSPGAFEDRNL
jgi:hypothetical protein